MQCGGRTDDPEDLNHLNILSTLTPALQRRHAGEIDEGAAPTKGSAAGSGGQSAAYGRA